LVYEILFKYLQLTLGRSFAAICVKRYYKRGLLSQHRISAPSGHLPNVFKIPVNVLIGALLAGLRLSNHVATASIAGIVNRVACGGVQSEIVG